MKTGRGWLPYFKEEIELGWEVCEDRESAEFFCIGRKGYPIRVRILKESDYRKLAKVTNLYEKLASECTEEMRMSCRETAPIRESIKVFDNLVKNQKAEK